MTQFSNQYSRKGFLEVFLAIFSISIQYIFICQTAILPSCKKNLNSALGGNKTKQTKNI